MRTGASKAAQSWFPLSLKASAVSCMTWMRIPAAHLPRSSSLDDSRLQPPLNTRPPENTWLRLLILLWGLSNSATTPMQNIWNLARAGHIPRPRTSRL